MSAQVITALRKRADALEAASHRLKDEPIDSPERIWAIVKDQMANEFRALANEAEGRDPI